MGILPIGPVTLNRRFLISCAALLLTLGPARAAEQAGVVTAVQGVAVAETRPTPRALAENGSVFLEELLRTGDESRLGLRLGETTSVRLGARSKLRIDRFIVNAGGELRLGSGQLLLEGPEGGFPRGLKVSSPYALLAVRGTKFFAGQLDRGFSVFVERGEVRVRAGGVSVDLGPGDGTDIARPGGRPEPAKKWGQPKIDRAMALVN